MNPYARHRASAAYRSAAETVTPARAIVMLYDGAIKRLTDAKSAIEDKRVEDRYNAVMKAYDIVNGLHCHLDHEAGGEIAAMLDRYYNYILHRLTMINIADDASICDEVIAKLREMRTSWAYIATEAGTPPSNDRTDGNRETALSA